MRNRCRLHWGLWLLCVMFSLLGCQKEVTRLPEIEIISPSGTISISVPDTVVITARVSDPELRSISVALVDENFINAGVTVIVPVTGTAVSFNAALIISNPALKPGKYSIRVRAANNEEQTSAWIDVNLRQQALARKGYAIAVGGGFDTQLYLIDTASNPTLLYGGVLNLRRILFDGLRQQVALVPNRFGNFSGFALPAGNQIWQIDAMTSGGSATFISGSSFANTFWIGLYDGRLQRIGPSGGTDFSINTPYNLLPRQITGNNNYVLVAGGEVAGTSGKLLALDPSVGGIINEFGYSGTVTALTHRNEFHCLVALRNPQGETQLFSFQVNNAAITPLQFENASFTMQLITRLTTDPGGNQLFALTEQGVFKWTPNLPSFTLFRQGNFNGNTLVWDQTDGSLLVGSGNDLQRLDPNSGNLTTIQSFPRPIMDAAIWYNR